MRVLEGRRLSDGDWYGEVVADRCLCCERPLTEEMVAKALYLVNAPAEGTPWEELGAERQTAYRREGRFVLALIAQRKKDGPDATLHVWHGDPPDALEGVVWLRLKRIVENCR